MQYLIYCFRETGANFLDYRGLSAVALVTSALSMLCVGLFFVIYVNIHEVVQALENEITMNIYLDEGLAENQILILERVILLNPEVGNLEFVSHRDAIEAYLERYQEEEALVASLGEQALPASFMVSLAPTHRTVAGVTSLAKKIEGIKGVSEIQYGQEWIQAFGWGTRLLMLIGSIVGATLALASIAIVANTIRLTLFNRKHDIDILRLLGATEAFIRGPFLVEGVAVGALGAGVSLILLKIIFESFIYRVGDGLMQGHAVAFLSPAALGALVGCGACLGFVGAILSLRPTRKAWV
ncbi:MAG TPA: FtsX-like permease family protein [Nitrospirales bacterium]|nr:FtsX-like permease family protein [Nitrospirales bacterium]